MDYGQEILNGAQVSHGEETDTAVSYEGKFAFVTLGHACHVPNTNTAPVRLSSCIPRDNSP